MLSNKTFKIKVIRKQITTPVIEKKEGKYNGKLKLELKNNIHKCIIY